MSMLSVLRRCKLCSTSDPLAHVFVLLIIIVVHCDSLERGSENSVLIFARTKKYEPKNMMHTLTYVLSIALHAIPEVISVFCQAHFDAACHVPEHIGKHIGGNSSNFTLDVCPKEEVWWC